MDTLADLPHLEEVFLVQRLDRPRPTRDDRRGIFRPLTLIRLLAGCNDGAGATPSAREERDARRR